MLIEHFLVARSSAVDRETNAISVFEIVEEISIIGQMPVQVPLQAVWILKRAAEKGEIRSAWHISVTNPDGKTAFEETATLPLPAGANRVRARVNLALPINKAGTYIVRLAKGDDSSVSREITIEVQSVPSIGKEGLS